MNFFYRPPSLKNYTSSSLSDDFFRYLFGAAAQKPGNRNPTNRTPDAASSPPEANIRPYKYAINPWSSQEVLWLGFGLQCRSFRPSQTLATSSPG